MRDVNSSAPEGSGFSELPGKNPDIPLNLRYTENKGIPMKLINNNPYQNVIDFIDAAVDSQELMNWLSDLETLPDNLRNDHLTRMRRRMAENREPEKMIDIVRSINNREVLSAVNLVVKDVYDAGIRTKKYLKKYDSANFNVLITLLAAN